MHRTRATAVLTAAAVLTTTAVLTGLLVGTAQARPRDPADRLVAVFPSNTLTVVDHTQRTGLRVDLPLPDCTVQVSECNSVRLLDQLDGFDLDPRIALTFAGPVDAAAVAAQYRVRQQGGSFSTGLDRVVYDAASNTVHAHPVDQLAPGTTYRIDGPEAGFGVRPGGGRGRGGPPEAFTTFSATDGLTDMVRQLDDGSAYRAAGIAASQRGLQVDASFPAAGTTLAYTADLGSTTSTTAVPNTSGTGAGTYVFGSYLAPSWLTADVDIPQTPTRDGGPVVRGAARLPFVAIIPAGTAPGGGWPVAEFGHGFTRSDADLFLAAQQDAARGIATIATDVVGHGYGARSTWEVTRGGATTTVPAHARGVDQDGNGVITSTEGVSTAIQPAPLAQVGNRDGLRQTVADDAALVQALSRPAGLPLRAREPVYFGQSFGGIYGTMLAGVDRRISAFGLDVPGGPITEISRLSPAFRPLVTQALGRSVPSLLNGGYLGFTESVPLAGGPAVTDPAAGSLAIQQFLAEGTWLNRAGSPETFAPLVPHDRTLVQSAYGDMTVPNPTAGTLVRAGHLQDRVSFYRNDETANAGSNPHGFLLDPTFVPGNALGQLQMSTFLASGGRTVIDPDGPLGVFEVPITDPDDLQRLNFASPLAG